MARQGGFPNEPTMGGSSGASSSTPGMTDRVQDTASRVVEKAQETAAPAVDRASEVAGNVMDQATEQAASRLDMGKDYAVEALTGVAQALRQTSQHLREEGAQPMLAQYVESGADQLESFNGYLRRNDVNTLVTEVESYARRSPTVFAGGAFALGLLAARFFRSTGRRSQASLPQPRPAMRPPVPSRAPSGPVQTAATRPAPTRSSVPSSSVPPSYANASPATGTGSSSPERMTPPAGQPTPGSEVSPTRTEAERLAPTPGTRPAPGTTPAETRSTTGDATRTSERPGSGQGRQI